MGLIDLLTDSPALRINRFPDIDHFSCIERLIDARSIPLDTRNFAAAYAAVTLKSCSIYLQHTFPRILQGRYRTRGTIVAFAMHDVDSVILNGVEIRNPSVSVINGSATCDMVEQRAHSFAIIDFHAMDDRGWPLVENSVQTIAVDPRAFQLLRSVTRDILLLASDEHEQFLGAVNAMEESLLEAIDDIFSAKEWALAASRPNLSSYLALVRRLDDLLAQNTTHAACSADVAQQLGVSVRTMHNAVVAIRGMSPHRYFRLRRLWNVRRQLVQGSACTRIKAVAFANGFWHMGEFARHYRAAFGETPQQTLQHRH